MSTDWLIISRQLTNSYWLTVSVNRNWWREPQRSTMTTLRSWSLSRSWRPFARISMKPRGRWKSLRCWRNGNHILKDGRYVENRHPWTLPYEWPEFQHCVMDTWWKKSINIPFLSGVSVHVVEMFWSGKFWQLEVLLYRIFLTTSDAMNHVEVLLSNITDARCDE